MIRFSLYRAMAVLSKEFIQLKRDKVTLRMIVMIPVMQLLLFGYALDNDPKHLPTAILSQDNSAIARAFVAGLKNTEHFSIDYDIRSDQEGDALLKRGDAFFVITIPNDLERDMVRGARPQILIEADGTNPIAISGALAAANFTLTTVLKQELKGPLAFLSGGVPPIEIRTHRRFNPEGFTRYNIVPGLIAIILTMTGIMTTSLAMTRERERGTMENLLAMPVSPLEVMVGKIMPYILIGFFQSVLIIIFAKMLFGVPIIGSLGLLFSVLTIFIACNMAIGFTISAIAQNQTQALQMSFMMILPSILLSGFLFPFQGMPDWAQVLGNIIPATYFIHVSRGILLKGSDLAQIWPHVWPLIVFMVIIIAVAMRFYRRTLD